MKRSGTSGEEGFILVFTLLLLVVVTLLVSRLLILPFSNRRCQPMMHSINEHFPRPTVGLNVAGVVIEENVSCPTGFNAMPAYSGDALIGGNVLIESTSLSLWGITPTAVPPSDINRNAYFFYDSADATGPAATSSYQSYRRWGDEVATGAALADGGGI